MTVRFSSKAGKHNVPRRSAWHVVMTSRGIPVVMNWGEPGLWYIGIDDRGIELEVGTVQRGVDELIVHAMPTGHRHERKN